jgi:SAM-dependent methyltransferase
MLSTDVYGSWDRIQAEKFRRMKGRLHGEILEKLLQGQVLDIGCGSGFLQRELPGDYIGVDNDEKMLRSSVVQFPRVLGDGNKLPFSDYSFDSIVSMDTMHLIRTKDFARVLRPGGLVLFTTFFNDENYEDRRKMLLEKLKDFVIVDEFTMDTKEKEYVVVATKPTFR